MLQMVFSNIFSVLEQQVSWYVKLYANQSCTKTSCILVNTICSYRWLLTVIGRSCKDGAATTINCAVNPQLNTQQALYYDSCRPVQSSAVSRWLLITTHCNGVYFQHYLKKKNRTQPYSWAVSSNGSVYNPPSCEPALNYACFSSQMAVVQPAVSKIMHYDIALWQSQADAHTIVSLRFMETHLITETAA